MNNLKHPTPQRNRHQPPDDAPWRSMTSADALAWLVAEDAARRARENPPLGMAGAANRKKLVAWRRANERCPKCGRAIPADQQFVHCRRCRAAFAEYQRHVNANLTEPQRLARNERARRSYHKLTHGRPPPPEVVTPPGGPMVTPGPMVTRNQPGPMVTPMVTPGPMVTRPKVVTHQPGGPKRDRAAYMVEYRANRKLRSGKK